jgi:hypothetical protein
LTPDLKRDTRKPQGSQKRWLAWIAPVLCDLALTVRIARDTHNVFVGVGSGVLLAAVVTLLVLFYKRRVERQLAAVATGPLAIPAFLDLSCLPGNWPAMAAEALGSVGGSNAYGMNVTLAVSDGYLTIARRKVPTTGKRAFTARVPLRAVGEIVIDKSRMTLGGSSMTFALDSGEQLRVDVTASMEATERVTDRFRGEVRNAGSGSSARRSGIDVTSLPPPVRASPVRARVSVLAFIPAWVISLVGLRDGIFAGVTVIIGLFASIALMMLRPRWMTVVLVWLMGLGAVAFVIDAVRTSQPLRLGGAAYCVLMATWMARKPTAADEVSPG